MVRAKDASRIPSRQGIVNPEQTQRPKSFIAIGVFLLFGGAISVWVAITLLRPGTALDQLWTLNKTAHAQLASLGPAVAVGFVVLSALLLAASVGWFRRRRWGWRLGTTIIAINASADLLNALRGDWRKGFVGVAFAGLLLFYMTRSKVRHYFRPAPLSSTR